jgi:hypothetical protein
MADTTDITSYKVYFADNSAMNDRIELSDGSDVTTIFANTFSVTRSDIGLVDGQTYHFIVVAIKSDGTELSSNIQSAVYNPAQPAIIRDFRVDTPVGTPAPTPAADYAINFQPADAPVPDGFQADSGLAFDETRGYGWISGPASLGPRDRDNSISPDQSYDTMIHVSPAAVWEYSLPNGNYSVTVCMGDPSWPTGTENVQVESNALIDSLALSSSEPWVEKTTNINISDGRLTITFNNSTDPARICWVKITSL